MIAGFLSVLLITSALCVSIPFTPPARRLWTFLLIPLVFFPFEHGSVATWLFGAFGALSIPTLALLASHTLRTLGRAPLFSSRDQKAILVISLLGGLLLYPATLGLTPLDPYALGYHSALLFGLLVLGLVAAWFVQADRLCLLYSLALIGSLVNFYESRNVIDALLDPLLFIYAPLALLRDAPPASEDDR